MATKAQAIDTQPFTLPLTGYSRASQLLPFLPFGKTTLFKWSGDGRFPSPVKLSSTITCWKNEDVHAWIKRQGISQQAANDSQVKGAK
jgi:predicted DNA-binding transcriptional regulator AlpA